MVIVDDHDADVSDERDTINVTVTTSSGEKLLLKALETDPIGNARARQPCRRVHGNAQDRR